MLSIMEAIAITTTNTYGELVYKMIAKFNMDSAKISIEYRCSAYISHKIENFDKPISKVK